MITGVSMTELRKDPASGRWVVVQQARGVPQGNGVCPFCPGQEAATPPEIAAYRTNGQPPNSPAWLVRGIPDRSPLLQIEGDIHLEGVGLMIPAGREELAHPLSSR
jgi:UDPglucose--hexose-1-phosphate uridylyltransferase